MKKKAADYFPAKSSPYGESGPISGVQVTPMSVPTAVPEFQYKNGVQIPTTTGYPVSNPVFELDKQMALQQAAQRAAALNTNVPPDMYQQAVALDPTREPAAVPVERTLPMNADEATMARVMALNGNIMSPAIDPTVRVPDQVVNGLTPIGQGSEIPRNPTVHIEPFDPAFVDLTRGTRGPTTRPSYAPQVGNILRDSAGNPVMSGGQNVGLPAQSVGNVATGGGKGGAGGK